jgi:hypothetical protein
MIRFVTDEKLSDLMVQKRGYKLQITIGSCLELT